MSIVFPAENIDTLTLIYIKVSRFTNIFRLENVNQTHYL
jgi:hypothetical protein